MYYVQRKEVKEDPHGNQNKIKRERDDLIIFNRLGLS